MALTTGLSPKYIKQHYTNTPSHARTHVRTNTHNDVALVLKDLEI